MFVRKYYNLMAAGKLACSRTSSFTSGRCNFYMHFTCK